MPLDGPPDSGSLISCAPVGQIPGGAIHAGSAWIRSQMDVDAIAGICEIDGSVFVEPGPMTKLSLPNLEAITGGLYVRDFGGWLTAIDLPQLQMAPAGIAVVAPALDRLEVGPIAYVDYLAIVGVSKLTNLDSFDHLTAAGSIYIVSNPQLTHLGLGALTTLSNTDSVIVNNPRLPTCEADRLRRRVMQSIGIIANDDTATCMPAVGP